MVTDEATNATDVQIGADEDVETVIEQWQHGGQTVPENARLTHRYCNVARGRGG